MYSGGPARVHALKNMIQHSPSFFSFSKIRVLNVGGTPQNLCLKIMIKTMIFFNFQRFCRDEASTAENSPAYYS